MQSAWKRGDALLAELTSERFLQVSDDVMYDIMCGFPGIYKRAGLLFQGGHILDLKIAETKQLEGGGAAVPSS